MSCILCEICFYWYTHRAFHNPHFEELIYNTEFIILIIIAGSCNTLHITYSSEILTEIFKIGIPTLIFQLLTSFSISLSNHAAGCYGDSAIAGMGVVTRLISIESLSVFGFIKGFQPIAGYSWGAKKIDRLLEAVKISILWSRFFV